MTAPEKLYEQLVELCASTKAFNYKDVPSGHEGTIYRIFSYYLTSYTDYLKPGALECRGTMFYVDTSGKYLGIASRTPQKFFNLGENPFTLDLDLTDPILVMKKEDGSLMSTYLDVFGELKLKSKASTSSTQCLDAMKFLEQNLELKRDLAYLAEKGFTVNLEWTAPQNRIVVCYEKPQLTGLSVIENSTGEVHFLDLVEYMDCAYLANVWVAEFEYDGDLSDVVKNMGGEEGVVCVTASGVTCKIKSEWYSALHRNLSALENAKGIVEIVLMEKSDDLKSMFRDNLALVRRINAYETVVGEAFNSTISRVHAFHDSHKHLGRKEYAMSAKDYWRSGKEFSVQMSALCGRDFTSQLKEQMIRNADEYERRVLSNETTWRIVQVDPDAFLPDLDLLERESRTLH